jgi:hypothetical protein
MRADPVVDVTVPWDDGLCERFMACLTCGTRRAMLSLDMILLGGLPMLAPRCLRCHAADRDATQLIARLVARGERNCSPSL